VNTERLRWRITELREEFDYVVIDGPPLDVCSDALGLGKASDGIVMVLEANSTRKDTAAKAVASLRECQIPVLGAVLNKRTFPIPARLYKRL
jgi:Mrp family chromosome partitioning ATPase